MRTRTPARPGPAPACAARWRKRRAGARAWSRRSAARASPAANARAGSRARTRRRSARRASYSEAPAVREASALAVIRSDPARSPRARGSILDGQDVAGRVLEPRDSQIARAMDVALLGEARQVILLEGHPASLQLLRRSFHVIHFPQRGCSLVRPGELRTIDTQRRAAAPIHHCDAGLSAHSLESQRLFVEPRCRLQILDRQHGLYACISQHAGAPLPPSPDHSMLQETGRFAVTASDTHRAIEAVFRIESARLIAGLARFVHDVGLAEELAQDALVAALQQWPESGVPDNPGAWLMASAKNRAIDLQRRSKRLERKHEELGLEIEQRQAAVPDLDAAIDDDVGDDLLRLVLISCHPVLSTEARVALTLRLLGGLTTEEIARAFLVPEPTVAQRIVRAKRTLAEKRVPFEVPRGPELAVRLSSVLEVLYLVFNEGYSATAGDDWMRPELCEDALRPGRRAHLAPRSEPRALGPPPHPSWPRGARTGRGARRRAGPVRVAGRHRSLSRTSPRPGGDGLGAHRGALPGARPRRAIAGRRAESGGRYRDG